MKLIDIFNVKHGDFGVYKNIKEEYICVLDCGTSQPKSRLHTSCLTPKRIINIVSYKLSSFNTKDILISHYHDDHFNGISAFKKRGSPFFRNMYVPYIDFKAAYTKQFLYSMCLLKATSDVLKIPFTLLKRFSSLFTGNYAQNHIMLHKGHILRELKDSTGAGAEIVWPPKFIYVGDSNKLKKFIDKLEGALRKHDLEDAIKKTEEYFSKLQEQLKSQKFSSLDSESQEREEQMEVDINKIFNIETFNERKGVEGAFKELRDAVKNFLDALSIGFRINNKLIWMGDITDGVLAVLKQDLQGDIGYFKLPHHGTRDISILNIRASQFVVSLSDGKSHWGRYDYKSINENNLKKAWKDNTSISCTDGHRYCHKSCFPFSCWDYLPCGTYTFFEDHHCSRNTVIRINL